MDKFKQTVLSDEFVSAVSDASISGKPINFTTAFASTAVLTDDQTAANSYANSQKFSKDTSGNVSGYNNTDTNTIVISVELNNSGLSADVKVSSIFIYAQYNSKDILVATARLNDPELLPAYNGTPVTLEYELYMTLQKTSNVTVQFNNAGLVTRQEGARIDAGAVHITGDETVNGVKSFLQKIKGTIEKADKSDLAAKATQLATSHKIGGLAFDGTQDLTLPGVNAKGNQDTTGLAAKATQLATSHKIGGLAFDGTQDLTLPGVNAKGNQDTTGLAAKATQLANNRTIKLKGVVNGSATFDGTQDITIATDPTITENNLNADLSTFSSAGNFYVYGTLTNSPISSGYALLQVFKMNGGLVQAFTDLQTEKTYTRTNISSQGYGNWILNADDSTVVHKTGNQSIAGSLTIPVDNSMINVGNDADLAMVKKQGQGGTLVVGNGKTFKLQKSSSTKISPTDTLTDLLTVDQNGNLSANSFSGIIQPRNTNITDLNNIVDSGVYKIPNSFTNIPNGIPNGGILEVYTYDDNVTYQILYVQGISVWRRYKFGATWYSWILSADDTKVVHNSGDETVDGVKSFKQTIDGNAKTATSLNVHGLVSNIDLNTVTTPGNYRLQSGSPTNSPVQEYFSLNVSSIDGFNLVQELISSNGECWTRGMFGYPETIWSEWKNSTNGYVNKIESTDANTVIQTGTYVFNGANLPSANDYYVFVTRFDDNKIKQVAMRDYDNAIYVRTKTGGKWYDWQIVSSTSSTKVQSSISDNGFINNINIPGSILNNIASFSGYCGVTKAINKGNIIGKMNSLLTPYQDTFIAATVNYAAVGTLILKIQVNGDVVVDTVNYNGQTTIPTGAYIYFSSINYPKI